MVFSTQSVSALARQLQVTAPVQSAPSADATNPVVHLQATDLRRFDRAFTALSEQGKIAFAAEGKPFVSKLSDDDLDKLAKSLPAGDAATLREVTDLVAHAYDYDVVRLPAQPGLVLLLKRYSNPKDFPQISCEEAERSLHNILLATNPLNPRMPFAGRPGSPFNRLYNSLTAEQRTKLNDPTPIADLRPEQKQDVWQLAHQSYFMPMALLDNVYAYLKGLEDPRTEFCWMDWTVWMNSSVPLFVFGWEGPFGPNHGNHRTAISHNLSIDPGGPTGLAIPYKAAVASGLLDAKTGRLLKPLPDDVTAPGAVNTANAAPEKTAQELEPNTLTLREAVQKLNESAASIPPQPGSERFHATVDDALARKTVTLIGTQATPPFNLLDALSRVYGLWIVAQKDKSYLLTLRAPRPCKEAADVPQEIRRLFPEPMWRAMESGAIKYENSDEEVAIRKRRDEISAHIDEKLREGYLKALAQQNAFQAETAKRRMRVRAAQAMNLESIRRIRALVEPQVPKDSGKRLPVVQVGEEAHDALAIFHLTQAVQTLDDLMTRPVPVFLQHFDRATFQVIMGTQAGPDHAAFDIGILDEEGIPRPGFSLHFQMKPQ